MGVRDGQTLIVGDGGTIIENFNAGRGSRVRVLPGGQVGNNLEAVAATVDVQGDATTMRLFDGSTLNVVSGEVDMIHAQGGSVANIAGGDAAGGGGSTYFENSTLNISGGLHPVGLGVRDAILNISGGSQGQFAGFPQVNAIGATTLNVYGTQFLVDGAPIAGLITGVPFTITQRDVELTGLFVDGRPFKYELNISDIGGEDYFPSGTTVTVTHVGKLPGDYNGDDKVDAADYVVWRKALGASVTNGVGADGNFNGLVDDIDYTVWRTNFGRTMGESASFSGNVIPEPRAAGSVYALLAMVLLWRQVNIRCRIFAEELNVSIRQTILRLSIRDALPRAALHSSAEDAPSRGR
jgi:hypothetical protein